MNLAVNARDAMPRGGRLVIETRNVGKGDEDGLRCPPGARGDYVLLAVHDTGCGIPPQVRAHLFEPFFTTKEPGKGTGLGLSVVYGIVKQGQGHISCESGERRGTTFRIWLPRQAGQAVQPQAAPPPPRPVRGSEVVLVLDDDEAIRKLVRTVLQENGYTVLAADRPAAALRCVEHTRGRIHLLITDVVMPHMSGPELARRMSAAHPAMKVLFMSGYGQAACDATGLPQERIAFLQKPFGPTALAREARKLLDSPLAQPADQAQPRRSAISADAGA
jgi:CheY-like chemotaxis protein